MWPSECDCKDIYVFLPTSGSRLRLFPSNFRLNLCDALEILYRKKKLIRLMNI